MLEAEPKMPCLQKTSPSMSPLMHLLLHCPHATSQLASSSTANVHISSMTKLDQLWTRPLR